MNKLTIAIAVVCFSIAGTVAAAEDKAPMPETRGMQGMPPKAHDPANQPKVTCTPKAGTENMDHDPKDHPMADTRGMHGMDPAQHMEDCVSSEKHAPVKKGPHQHKAVPGGN